MACENCFVRFRSWLRGVPSASTIRTKTADSPFQSVPSEGVTLTTGCGNPLAALATAAKNCGCCANALAMYAKPLSRVLTGFCRARLLESLKLVSSKDRTSVAVPGRVTPYSLNFEPSQPPQVRYPGNEPTVTSPVALPPFENKRQNDSVGQISATAVLSSSRVWKGAPQSLHNFP